MSRAEASRKELIQAIIGQARHGSTRSVMLHAVVAERLGLNASDHKTADLLHSEAGVSTPGRLAELTGLSTGAITGVLDRLERAGFVVREADPTDRRRVLVRLTPQRAPNMERIFSPLMQGLSRLCDNYTTPQLELILSFMRASNEMAEKATEEVRRRTQKAALKER
ncbi:MAG: MarR family transcriptional regulator [Polyangiales bacterium]